MKKIDIKSLLIVTFGSLLFFGSLVTLTTSQATYSQELEIEGRTLQAKDIRRNHIPFTSIWLRRNIELIEKHSMQQTELIFRTRHTQLSPRKEPSRPLLEMKSESQILIMSDDLPQPIIAELPGNG